ncbi:hypothetical protein H3C61_01325 [Candidatus Gracilibacteria bacterium]|nr:hypothetical protein [Candidatus Gracilibacteria bacterium]
MKNLFEKLGIVLDNENLFETNKNLWKNKIPFRYKKGLEKIKPNYFYIQENKPVILFFDNEINTEVFSKIWNFGGVPIVYVLKKGSLEIYNGFDFDTKNKTFSKIINEDISILDLISGKSFNSLNKKNNQVDKELLSNLREVINILEENGLERSYSQSLVGRLLFSRFLIDNDISIDKNYFSDPISFLTLINDKTKLYNYFRYLKDNFNGDLFPITDEEEKLVQANHLTIIHDLFSGNKINGKSNQQSLFDIYDFKIIPVELISEVYEQFMGDKKQKSDGAYYTPSFLVDYILEKSVRPYLESKNECKIFDPSCGSGIFLVESFRMLVEKNLDKDGKIEIKKLINLLENNIFGVDKNEIAINLSIFSLYLTLLDYVNPKNIGSFKFPHIKNVNLFVSDFFDTKDIFNEKIKDINFIIGNPPWGSDKEKDSLHIQFINQIKKEKKTEIISDKQISQSFILRLEDFIDKNTKISLILPSSILYNYNANNFRTYLLNTFAVNEVLELSPVRDYIFTHAKKSSIVLTISNYKEDNKNNIVIHKSIKPNIFIKLLKILVIEKNDIKEIKQIYFLDNPFLWKTLLYGNVFDFFFIKRLKDDFANLNKIIKENNFVCSGGIKEKDGNKKINIDNFKNFDFYEEDNVKRYIGDKNKINFSEVGFFPKQNVFEGPLILINKSTTPNFETKAFYTKENSLFKSRTFGIKGDNNNVDILKNITGLLNSSLSAYYLLLTDPQIGIDRNEAYTKSRLDLPICISNISTFVDKLQELYKNINNEILTNKESLEEEIYVLEKKLNDTILESFSISNEEKALIDYTKEITIPLINNNQEIFKPVDKDYIKDYANIFIDTFGEIWNGENSKFFEIDVYSNDYIIGMNFKVVNEKRKEIINFIEDKNNINEIFETFKIGESKITKDLYKIRDVRGFNENSFYIIKFNQIKNWHKGLAYIDINEFRDAMMKSGTKKINNN